MLGLLASPPSLNADTVSAIAEDWFVEHLLGQTLYSQTEEGYQLRDRYETIPFQQRGHWYVMLVDHQGNDINVVRTFRVVNRHNYFELEEI